MKGGYVIWTGVFNKCEVRGRASNYFSSKEAVMILDYSGLARVCIGGKRP